MTKEEIIKHLDGMLEQPKSRGFLNHLIRSYFPYSKTNKVFERPSGFFRCVITNAELFSLNDVINSSNGEINNNLMHSITSIFDGEENVKLNFGDKELGVTGEKTTTFLSINTYQVFYEWVITKTINGDKHINWILGLIRRESGVDTMKENTNKRVEKPKLTTYSLGDASDVLSKLKEKMESK